MLTLIKKHCLTCLKLFKTKPSRLKYGKGKYCSKKCYYESKRSPTGRIHIATRHWGMSKHRTNRPLRITVKTPDGRWIPEHRYIAEKALGRRLKKTEVVHHINCNETDNRPENLLICTNGYHHWLHGEYFRRYGQLVWG